MNNKGIVEEIIIIKHMSSLIADAILNIIGTQKCFLHQHPHRQMRSAFLPWSSSEIIAIYTAEDHNVEIWHVATYETDQSH